MPPAFTNEQITQMGRNVQWWAAFARAHEPDAPYVGDKNPWSLYKAEFATVIQQFDRFKNPDPQGFDPLLDAFLGGSRTVFKGGGGRPDIGRMKGVGSALLPQKDAESGPRKLHSFPEEKIRTTVQSSFGDTFDVFEVKFLDRVDPILRNHSDMAKFLGNTARNAQRAYANARRNIMMIGAATIGKLKFLAGHGDVPPWTSADTLSLIAIGVGWIPVVGDSVATYLSLNAIAEAHVPQPKEVPDKPVSQKEIDLNSEITGNSAEDIIGSMNIQIAYLVADLDRAENTIKKQLTSFHNVVKDNRKLVVIPGATVRLESGQLSGT